MKTYSSDLESTIREEIVQFAELVPPNVQQLSGNVEVGMYRIIMKPGIRETFSNVEVALRLYFTLLVPNCSGERSFSTLKRVKNEIRTTMTNERLNQLSLMFIET